MKIEGFRASLAAPIACCLSAYAHGAVVAASSPDSASESDSLTELVVTANRTESYASKTPITLTAVSDEQLASAGVTNPTQLMEVVPDLVIDRGNANGLQINIRGISSTGVLSPSVAFLVDGIYIQNANAQEVSFFDLERVEVLRGPQGTLYGRNTTAGVINLISASPTDTYGASADLSYGNYNHREATAMVNLPVNEQLGFRLAVNYDARDSYYDQTAADPYRLPLDKDNKSARLTALYKPTDAVKLLVKFDYTGLEGAGAGFGTSPLISNFYQVPLTAPPAGVREPSPTYLNPSASQALARNYADAAPFATDDKTYGVSTELTWDIANDWTLTWLGGHRVFSRDDNGSVFWGSDYSTGTMVNTEKTASTREMDTSESQELRLAYSGPKLKVQDGLYFFRQDEQNTTLYFGNFGLPIPRDWNRSLGAFAQATYSVTDQWRVTAGVRYTKDDVFQSGQTELILPFGPLILASTDDRGSSSKTTWKAETDYDVTASTMAYATVATGYKAIAFNTNCVPLTTLPCVVKPEDLTDYEIGIKSKLLNNMLLLNAAIFHYKYDDLQISQIVPITVGGVEAPGAVTTNAAAARVDGLELEGSYLPFERNRFDFSASYLNARYTNYVISPGDPTSGNYDGAPLDHSPRVSATASYTYTKPLPAGSLIANVRARYSDKYAMLSTTANTLFWQPSFTKTDLSLGWRSMDSKWYVEGFVRNIENKVDVTYINTSPGWSTLNNGTVSTGDPRTYGARLSVKF